MVDLPFAVIPLDLGTIASGNERAESPAQHLGEFKYPGMVWQSTGATNVWASGGFGAARTIDFAAVLSANALAGTKIRLRLDNAPITTQTGLYDSGALSFISPSITRDDGLYHSHLELAAPVTASYWRIDISGHTGDFAAAALVLGLRQRPATYYNPDFERGIQDLGTVQMTPWGIGDETDGLIFRRLKMTFGWMSEADFEEKFRPLAEQLGTRGLALWCFDPAATAYRQARTYFGRLTDPPFATGGAKAGTFQMQFQILSMI